MIMGEWLYKYKFNINKTIRVLLGYSKHSLYINTKFKGEMIMLKSLKAELYKEQ